MINHNLFYETKSSLFTTVKPLLIKRTAYQADGSWK